LPETLNPFESIFLRRSHSFTEDQVGMNRDWEVVLDGIQQGSIG
jgi:hypothetical protein